MRSPLLTFHTVGHPIFMKLENFCERMPTAIALGGAEGSERLPHLLT